MGFAVPMASWLRGPLREWAEDLLSEDRLSRQGVLDVPAVRMLWRNFLSGKPRHDRILWNLLSFQSWLDQLDAGVNTLPPAAAAG
jgi:asparagine synthase (glutamine-hydrolysing)